MAGNQYYRFDATAAVNTAMDDDIARNIFTGAPLPATDYPPNSENVISTAQTFGTAGITVIRDQEITIEEGGRYAATVDGSHIYFVNCQIKMENTSTNQTFSFSATNTGSTNFGIPGAPGNRSGSVPNDEATSRTINFFGCSIIVTATGRVNAAVTRMDNCTVIRHSSPTLFFFYVQPPAEAFDAPTLGPGYYDNLFLNPNDLVNTASGLFALAFYSISSAANNTGFTPSFARNIQRSSLIAPINQAVLTFNGYQDATGTAAYFIASPSATAAGILSINPQTRLTAASEVGYNGSAGGGERIIEYINYLPTFSAPGVDTIPNIRATMAFNYVYTTPGSPQSLSTGLPVTQPGATYTTDTNGNLTGNYNPFNGSATLVPADGLIIPTQAVVVSGGASVLREYTSTLNLRSFNTVVDASDGEIVVTVDNDVATPGGANFTGRESFPIDTSLRQAAIDATDVTAYITGLADRTTSCDLQDINEVLKAFHYNGTTGLTYRTFTNDIVSWSGNIDLSSTATAASYDNATTTLTIPCNGTLDADSLTAGIDLDANVLSGPNTLTLTGGNYTCEIGIGVTMLIIPDGSTVSLLGISLQGGHPGLTIQGTEATTLGGEGYQPPLITTGITFIPTPAEVTYPVDGNIILVTVANNSASGIFEVDAGVPKQVPIGGPFHLYYKPTNTATEFYPVIERRDLSRDGGNITISAAPLPSVITAVADYPSEWSLTSTAASPTVVTVDLSTSTGSSLTAAQAKQFWLDVTDEGGYLRSTAIGLATEAISAEPIQLDTSGTSVNADYLTLDQAAGTQRQIALNGTNVQTGTTLSNDLDAASGVPVFTAIPSPAGISVAEVISALNQSDVASDTSATATQVNSMANDRLLGIRPGTHLS